MSFEYLNTDISAETKCRALGTLCIGLMRRKVPKKIHL